MPKRSNLSNGSHDPIWLNRTRNEFERIRVKSGLVHKTAGPIIKWPNWASYNRNLYIESFISNNSVYTSNMKWKKELNFEGQSYLVPFITCNLTSYNIHQFMVINIFFKHIRRDKLKGSYTTNANEVKEHEPISLFQT